MNKFFSDWTKLDLAQAICLFPCTFMVLHFYSSYWDLGLLLLMTFFTYHGLSALLAHYMGYEEELSGTVFVFATKEHREMAQLFSEHVVQHEGVTHVDFIVLDDDKLAEIKAAIDSEIDKETK